MPAIESTFRLNQPLLSEILTDIEKGKIQLPDFQRGWVWDDNHIRALIASISLSYPIGALMLLETSDDGVRFKPRLIEGVEITSPPSPDYLILDGQQRLTSLYLSFKCRKPVRTVTEKGQEIERHYYLDMAKCLDPDEDRFDAVVSVPAERVIRSDFGRKVDLDLSTREREYALKFFPLQLIFDLAETWEWQSGFQEHHDYVKELSLFLSQFQIQILMSLQKYKVPVIELVRETPKEAVCQVFENVNTGGVSLTVFELLTASYAADDFQLRNDWEARREAIHDLEALTGVDESDFLVAITLRASYRRSITGGGAVSCKRKDVLRLTLDEYKEGAPAIIAGMKMTARLLAREKVFDAKNVPYKTQLVPLSAICSMLGSRFDEDPVKQKLARWYWCGVFGELYGGANETRYALDIQNVLTWLDGGDDPATIRDANFTPTRLLTLQTRLSAAYKGIMGKLMQVGSNDFINGDEIVLTNYFDEAVDIHHIFPRAYCEREKLKREKWNCIVNKTPLTARTNRILGGNKPSTYIRTIENTYAAEPASLDAHMRTHLINPEFLRIDDFDSFIGDRAGKILGLIEQSMGKTVTGRDSDEVIAAFGAPLTT